MPEDRTWVSQANCRNLDPDTFFPGPWGPKAERLEKERAAKEICQDCRVKGKCLDYALSIRTEHGIWGGLNWEERKRVGRRRSA